MFHWKTKVVVSWISSPLSRLASISVSTLFFGCVLGESFTFSLQFKIHLTIFNTWVNVFNNLIRVYYYLYTTITTTLHSVTNQHISGVGIHHIPWTGAWCFNICWKYRRWRFICSTHDNIPKKKKTLPFNESAPAGVIHACPHLCWIQIIFLKSGLNIFFDTWNQLKNVRGCLTSQEKIMPSYYQFLHIPATKYNHQMRYMFVMK